MKRSRVPASFLKHPVLALCVQGACGCPDQGYRSGLHLASLRESVYVTVVSGGTEVYFRIIEPEYRHCIVYLQ